MRRWWNRHSAARLCGLGGTGLWSALGLGVVVVLDDVVDVAAPGRAGAPREHARRVPEDHLLPDPVGHLVRRCGEVGVEVDDRLDGDLGPGVAAPVLDLVEQHQALALLHPPGRTEHRGQVVEGWRRSGRGGRPRVRPAAVGVRRRRRRPGLEVERGLGAGEVAEGCGRGARPATRRSRGPSGSRRRGRGARSRSSASAMSSSASIRIVPAKCTSSSWMRGVARVDVEVAVLRVRGRVDVGEVVALDRLGDEPVQLRGTDATGDGGDLGVDERRSLDRSGRGSEWMVASATARARHAGTRPAWTCAHSRGRRWRSSRAWPTSFFAAVVEIPRTVPSSARQNSATSGAPSPAMGSSCSQPGTVNAAASWIDSGGCRSAHWAARTSWAAAARVLMQRAAHGSRTGRREAVRSSTSPAPGPASVSIMCSILPATTDSDHGRHGCGRFLATLLGLVS